MSFGNTVGDGSGTALWLLVDASGRLIMVGPAAHDAAAVGSPLQTGGVYRASDPSLDDGDVGSFLIDTLGRLKINSDWSPSLQAEESANDSDKEFNVPDSTEWRVKWIWVEYTADANAGNRQLEIQIQDDADDVIAQVRAGQTVAATQVRYFLFAPHCADLTAYRDTDYLMTPMPEWILSAGYDVRIWDNAAISAAGDDMNVQMMVEARSV